MGNLCSISVSIDDIVASFWGCTCRPANYICKLEENQLALRIALRKLIELRNDVKRKVDLAERQQMKPLDQVQGWLSRVEALETAFSEMRGSAAMEANRLGSYRIKGFMSRYNLGKKVATMLEEVATLRREGRFDVVADRSPPTPVNLRPSGPTVGLESKFEEVWGCLGEGVWIIGLYGLGGVGKTTLMTQINNALYKTTHDFDVVIWAVVSSDPDPRKVQDEIWKKIGFCDDIWKNKSQDDKAIEIFQILNKKKFVLFLDDIWKWFDLLRVGVPFPDQENKSKIVFTTRSEEVCCSMGAQKIIKVECLAWGRAWDLFRSKVGEDTINFHPDIPQLAKTVANECGGLPLALITIGRAMACKRTPREWNHAIKVLHNSASNFPGMPEDVLPLLKFSYDSLPNDIARTCFLYCSLYPDDRLIYKEDLVDNWIGEGFIDVFDHHRDGSRTEGYMIIGTLIRACLLEECGEYFVKMHDVIRDMALWIASEFGRAKEKFVVQVGASLTHVPEVAGWTGAKRISLINNQIEKLSGAPRCPNLSTLFLGINSLKVINGAFFQFMPTLRVLSFAQNAGITELPQEICNLVSLQYLDFSFTSVRELPIELKNLVRLKCLNINGTEALDVIPKGLISSLSTLKVLKMAYCGSSHDVITEENVLSGGNETLVEELELLMHLGNLSITLKSGSALNKFLSGKSWSYTRDLCFKIFNDSSSINISFLEDMKNLDIIFISHCSILEDLKVDWMRYRKETVAPHGLHKCFHSLHTVEVDRCPMLKDLAWLIFAPNLRHLFIINCNSLTEVIHKGVAEAGNVRGILSPFSKLERLYLSGVPELKSIYWNTLPFHCLKQIHANGCPKLKKLPLSSECDKEGGVIISGEEDWWNKLEWEDEATQLACIPHLRSQSYSTPKLR